jgi:hypothetical protein
MAVDAVWFELVSGIQIPKTGIYTGNLATSDGRPYPDGPFSWEFRVLG